MRGGEGCGLGASPSLVHPHLGHLIRTKHSISNPQEHPSPQSLNPEKAQERQNECNDVRVRLPKAHVSGSWGLSALTQWACISATGWTGAPSFLLSSSPSPLGDTRTPTFRVLCQCLSAWAS